MKEVTKEGIIPVQGTAVSIDICNSTESFGKWEQQTPKDFYSYSEIEMFQVIEKMYDAIIYSLKPYEKVGNIIQFTGDGALLFFEDPIGMSTTECAIEFGISFLAVWTKNCAWTSEFQQIRFRICLDKGKVMTNPIGGLWSGLALNYASKMRHKDKRVLDYNRITISEEVKNSLSETSIYRDLFHKTEEYRVSSDKIISLYNIVIKKPNIIYPLEIKNLQNVPICMCIAAIEVDFQRINAVLESIKAQTFLPQYVLVYTSIDNTKKLKDKAYPFKCHFFLLNSKKKDPMLEMF